MGLSAMQIQWPCHDPGASRTCDPGRCADAEGVWDDAPRTIGAQPCGEPAWQSQSVNAPGVTEMRLGKLVPASAYAVRVSAENAAGASHFSSIAEISMPGKAPLPAPEVVEVAASKVVLRWGPPAAHAAAVCIRQVEVAVAKVPHGSDGDAGSPQQATIAWQTVYRGCESACLVSGLSPCTAYAFRMRDVPTSGAGKGGGADADGGAWSACAAATTLLAAPPAPVALVASGRTPNSVRLSWSPNLKAGCAVAEAYRCAPAGFPFVNLAKQCHYQLLRKGTLAVAER